MDDLISRHQAINEANAWLLECLGVQKQDRSCGLIRRLEDLPSAQPEIVFCKQCKYFEEADEDSGDAWCYAWGNTTAGDQFCSCGENIKDE